MNVTWNFSATCIGSLPHQDQVKALDLVLSKKELIPFWPQLPKKGFLENMYVQYAMHLPGVSIDVDRKRIMVDLDNYDPATFYEKVISHDLDYFCFSNDRFTGFFEMISREPRNLGKIVKGQTTGPISEGLQIFDTRNRPVIYDESYCEIIRKNLNMMTKWQVRVLRSKYKEVIIFVDEPSLALLGTPYASIRWEDAIDWINDVFNGIDCAKGIHCCGNTDWSQVVNASIDILSFDAYEFGHTVTLFPEEISRFLDRGGVLAWGIVPNNDESISSVTIGSLEEKMLSLIRKLVSKGVDQELLIRNSLLTPQCGLGGMSEENAESAIEILLSLSRRLKKRFYLGDDAWLTRQQ